MFTFNYSALHLSDYGPTSKFLSICTEPYSNNPFFIYLRDTLFGFQEKYVNEDKDTISRLHLLPNNMFFLYKKDVALMMLAVQSKT